MATILVVEDEPAIREVTAMLLGRCGFVVHTAARPEGALTVIGRHPVDIVLTEIILHGYCDGCDLAWLLRRIGWSGGFIFTSGDPDAVERARRMQACAPILSKPYGRQTLLCAIDQLNGMRAGPRAALPRSPSRVRLSA